MSKDRQTENRWLGILAAFGVVWYIVLAVTYALNLTTSLADMIAAGMPQDQIDYIIATPVWAHSAKSIAVLAGLLGAIALFMRRSAAYWLLGLALFGTMIVMLDGVLRGGFQILGAASSGFSIVAILIAVFMFWFAHAAKNDGLI